MKGKTNMKKSKDIKSKDINWWRIFQTFCLMVFMLQMFVAGQLVIFNHYLNRYSTLDMIINCIVFCFALTCVQNLIPKDFHIKKETKKQ